MASRLTVLLDHLLKRQHEGERRSVSLRLTIAEQRRAIRRLLADSPNLKPLLSQFIASEYPDAKDDASYATSLPKTYFPIECPYSLEQTTGSGFWPE